MTRSAARATLGLGLVALFAAAGCSAIVSPGNGPIQCLIMGEGDPCPEPLRCINEVCVVPGDASTDDAGCVPREETCNNEDDDCDGVVDNGHDTDGDGFTWCGGGVLDRVDCNDRDPSVHPSGPDIPAATEICDGQDNDCDGMTDEMDGDALCPAGSVCTAGRCVDPMDCTVPGQECATAELFCDTTTPPPRCMTRPMTGCHGPSDCAPAEYCEGPTGLCLPKVVPGSACGSDAECTSGVCTDAIAFRVPGLPPRICALACCADSDCAADALCWAPGTGARTCLPRSLVMGGTPTETLCTSAAPCSGGTCRIQRGLTIIGRTDFTALTCGTAVGTSGPNGSCGRDSDCTSGMCTSYNRCTAPCGSDADCGWRFGGAVIGTGGFCAYYYADSADSHRDYLTACAPHFSASGVTGDSCGSGSDCRDSFCVTGTCADVCCNDSQCRGATHCRPRLGADFAPMLCLP